MRLPQLIAAVFSDREINANIIAYVALILNIDVVLNNFDNIIEFFVNWCPDDDVVNIDKLESISIEEDAGVYLGLFEPVGYQVVSGKQEPGPDRLAGTVNVLEYPEDIFLIARSWNLESLWIVHIVPES